MRAAGVVILGLGIAFGLGVGAGRFLFTSEEPVVHSDTHDATPSPSGEEAASDVEDESVWDPDEEQALSDLYSSCASFEVQSECVPDLMLERGASEEAADFYEQHGVFLTKFFEMGSIDVGLTLDPFLANNNSATVLLNGDPPVITPSASDLPVKSISNADAYALRGHYRDLDFSVDNPAFETVRSSNRGLGYIFQYELVDGCHACETGFSVRGILRFSNEGSLEGHDFVGICTDLDILEVPDDLLGVPTCPSLPRNIYPFAPR